LLKIPFEKQPRHKQRLVLPLWRSLVLCQLVMEIIFVISLSFPNTLSADIGIRYDVSVQGVTDRELRKTLEAVSDTFSLQKRPPASLNLLQRRVNRDIPLLLKVLKSQGYYGAKVTAEIEAEDKPIRVTFRIDMGHPYILKSINVGVPEEYDALRPRLPENRELGLVLGDPAKSNSILNAERTLIHWFKKNGFSFPSMVDRKVVVDHKERIVSVAFHVNPGPPARFGHTEINGIKSVDEIFLRGKIPWKEGDRFNVDILTDAQKSLLATDLFASVEVKTSETINEAGRLPVVISVVERKHRTIKAGVSYSTDEGAGTKVSWQHRNFLGGGERLDLMGTASAITYAAEGEFRKPDFIRKDQSLLFKGRIADDHPDAFTSRNLSTSVYIERLFAKEIRLGGGLAYKASLVEQLGEEERFGLLSLPALFAWDTSENLLDPVRGRRLTLQFMPFYGTFGDHLGFVKGYATYSQYVKLTEKPLVVLAGRSAFGSMAGASRNAIPADERFYAGGGNSIRGYAYQSVGPLEENKPTGGRSLMEVSLELRTKVTDTIGFVAFLDGGNASPSATPDLSEPLRWGAGAGIRYFTPVGPLRLDVAVPLNRRDTIDDRFHIYISLGQAF